MSFLSMFKKTRKQQNSSESSYTSKFSDEVSGDHVINSRDLVVQDAESLWDCRDRIVLNLHKIKTEVDRDEVKIQPKDEPIIVSEFQPDTTASDNTEPDITAPDTTAPDLEVIVPSQPIDQSTPVTDKSTAGNSQQTRTNSSIKRVAKKTVLPSMTESQNIKWDESCTSINEWSTCKCITLWWTNCVNCRRVRTAEYPKHVTNRVLAPLYCSCNGYHCRPCSEFVMPVHKIAYGVTVLVIQVFEIRMLLERCLQQTDHQTAVQKSEIQLRLRAAAAEAKNLTGELTFLANDVNHTTGTPDQIKMLIDIYDACFRRFKKIVKTVCRIEMPPSEGMDDDNDDRGYLSTTDQN